MPRDFFKKIIPAQKTVADIPQLRWLQEKIKKPSMWGYTRTNITRAVFIGLFWAMIPIPFQMLPAALCAYRFSANISVSLALVWVTNPFTTPFIFYFQYWLGMHVLGWPEYHQTLELSWYWLWQSMHHIAPPFFVGVFFCALLLPLIGYVSVNQMWIWQVKKSREKKRKLASKNIAKS